MNDECELVLHWIDFNDRTPPLFTDVLVSWECDDEICYGVASLVPSDMNSNNYRFRGHGVPKFMISHWMMIPEFKGLNENLRVK